MSERISSFSLLTVALLLAGCDDPPTNGDPERGRIEIRAFGCGACHEIAGVRGATGRVGPPLLAVGRHAYIAGILPNTPDNLVAWLQNPPAIDPKTAMPNLGLTAEQAQDITAYLYTLRGGWP